MPSREFNVLYRNLRAQPDRAGLSIDELRETGARKASSYPVPDDVAWTPVSAGGVPAEWVAAEGADPERTLLYFHGGGYYRGSPATVRELCGRISRAGAVRVLSVDYRLAPENPFPAAVEDVLAAYAWLRDTGTPPGQIAVGGDSSGGGLTVALLVALRDAGTSLPRAAVCLSPWVDLTQSGDSYKELAPHDPTLSKAYLDRFAELYLDGADPLDPRASPLFADLSGLPPMLVQVGGREILRDDGLRLAERASAQDVPVHLDFWEDMIHVWQNNGPDLPEGLEAVTRIGAFLHAQFA